MLRLTSIALLFVAGTYLLNERFNPSVYQPTIQATAVPAPCTEGCPTLTRMLEKHVSQALGEVDQAARTAVEPVAELFKKARGNTRAFAGDSMGFYGKYCALADLIPWTSHARLRQHLEERFGAHFFKPEDLGKAIETAAERFGGELESIESRMIVRLRAEMESLPDSGRPDAVTLARLGERLRFEIEKARAQVLGANAEHGAVLAGGTVVSSVAGPVLVAAMESAIAAVLARTAGPTAAATTGTGLGGPLGFVTFLAVEMLVEWVWDWWTDPRGRLANQLDDRLKSMEKAIIEGDGQGPGMRETLKKAGERRLDQVLEGIKAVLAHS